MNDYPRRKLRQAALAAGVDMIAPETVFLSEDNTAFGKHVTIARGKKSKASWRQPWLSF
jgi:hypothetical protein